MQGRIALTKLLVVLLSCVLVLTLTVVNSVQAQQQETPEETTKKPLSLIFATMTCSLAATPDNLSTGNLLWSLKTSALPIPDTSYMSLVARPYLDTQSRCPATLEEKTEFISFVTETKVSVKGATTQIIVPSIKINELVTSFKIRDVHEKRFCLYLQQDLNPEDEWLITPTTSAPGYPGGYQMRKNFCDSCSSSHSVGCDPISQKCYCVTSFEQDPTIDPNCNTAAEVSTKLNLNQCVWANTDTFSSTTSSCSCANFWSGPTCAVCSLEDCSASSGTSCRTCVAPVSTGSGEAIKTPAAKDCSKCECTDPYYRGHICGCRSAIFDIDGTFTYPTVNITKVNIMARSTKDSVYPELSGMLLNKVFLQEIRLALALDLNIPMFNIEIITFSRDLLRVAVSPWCATQFSAMYLIDHPDATRAETSNTGTSANVSTMEMLSQADPELQGQNIDQSVLSRLHALKQSYLQRHGRSPTDTSDWAHEQALGPRGTADPNLPSEFQVLHNTINDPFMVLMDKLQTFIDTSEDSTTSRILNDASRSDTFQFRPQQLYFPQCGDDPKCLNLGPNPYQSTSKSNSVIIIVIVIVVVVVVLAIAVGSCLYCNSKKICCFKSIAEYNERKKRKAAERGTRTGSGGSGDGSGGSGSGGSASGDKSGDGSNSGPKGTEGSGVFTAGAIYHGSSASNVSDLNTSGPSAYIRPSGSNSGTRPAATRRTSTGGRQSTSGVEMSSNGAGPSRAGASRNTSRGGRSRQSKMEGSRVGGLRASRVQNPQAPQPIGEATESNGSELPLPVGWEKAVAQDGKTYFVNTETLTSQWTHPALPSDEKERSMDDLDEEFNA